MQDEMRAESADLGIMKMDRKNLVCILLPSASVISINVKVSASLAVIKLEHLAGTYSHTFTFTITIPLFIHIKSISSYFHPIEAVIKSQPVLLQLKQYFPNNHCKLPGIAGCRHPYHYQQVL